MLPGSFVAPVETNIARITSSRPAGSYAVRVHSSQSYRIVQWNTGNVGKTSVQAIVANPAFDLVGCYA
jgi:hypothetical protein